MSLLKSGRPTREKAIKDVINDTNELVRMNFQVDKSMYKKIKIYAAEHEMTLKDLLIKSVNELMSK